MTPPDIPTPPTQFFPSHHLPAVEIADKTSKLKHLNTQKVLLSKGSLCLAFHLGDKEGVHQRGRQMELNIHPQGLP